MINGPDIDGFVEEAYLERYTDVANAVDRGDIPSGRAHYEAFGRAEGRVASRLLVPERIALGPMSKIMTFENPALETVPPSIIGRDLIPEDLHLFYASLWDRKRPASTIDCHLLEDVIVAGDGLVFDNTGQLVAASAHQTSMRQIEAASLKVRDYLADGGGSAVGGTTLICEKIGVGNYFHWLIEMAPIVYLLRDRLIADWFLRAPIVEGSPGLSGVIRDTLDLLTVDPARVRWSTGAIAQRYEKVVLTSGFSHHGLDYSPIVSKALDEMADQVPAGGKCKIWVSRADFKRRMYDEANLCDALAAKGWKIVSPGTMSLRGQIALFKNAEVVAGVNGAGLSNFGFSPHSTQVIVFAPARIRDISFWMLAQMKRQRYTEVRCRQEHCHDGAFNWEGMLMMEANQALKHIDAIEAR